LSSKGSLKPDIAGLIDRQSEPSSAYDGILAGWVVNVGWSDLQPNEGGAIVHPNPIDDALTAVAQRTGMRLKIRFEKSSSGAGALGEPAWVQHLGGDPVQVTDPTDGATGLVGRWWTSQFRDAYADLQTKLAAAYDGNAAIADVTIARCTTIYSEPFIRDISSAATVQALLAAHYTVAADEQCQEDQITAHDVWKHTHSSLSFNPYETIAQDGTVGQDEAFTESMMSDCRSVLGERCTLENNSIRQSSLGGSYDQMYAAMKAEGPWIHFQTATSAKVGDLPTVLQWAVGEGANAVELPGGYENLISTSALEHYASELAEDPQ
jgi:hypothetical protein